jgi:hypothetical protein
MQKTASNAGLKRIQVENMRIHHENTSEQTGHAVIVQKSEGSIELTIWAVLQLLHGARVCKADPSQAITDTLVKLSIATTEYLVGNGSTGLYDKVGLYVTRAEMMTMRLFLEARMQHCEQERDENKDEFNPDTYIQQKFLLLDQREWLMVQAVGEVKLDKEPTAVDRWSDKIAWPTKSAFEESRPEWAKRFESIQNDLEANTYGDQTGVDAALRLANIRKDMEACGFTLDDYRDAKKFYTGITV